jgi:RHS repeat-associated protein
VADTAYGQSESDVIPDRYKGLREDVRFTGNEDDVEVGLTAFAKRYYAPALGRWASPDPLAVHAPGEADLNLYAYVHGRVYAATDPLGLMEPDAGVAMPSGGPSLVEVAKSWWNSAKERLSDWANTLDAKRIKSQEAFGPAPQGGLLGEVVDRTPSASANAWLVMTTSRRRDAPARVIVEKELAATAPAAPIAPLGEAAGGVGRRFHPDRLVDHFERHSGDFGARTAAEYEQMADRFLTGPRPEGVLERVRPNGDVVVRPARTSEDAGGCGVLA